MLKVKVEEKVELASLAVERKKPSLLIGTGPDLLPLDRVKALAV